MVGKSNISKYATHGAAVTTPGFSALDEEREASMADEGGAAGAQMETQEDARPFESLHIDAVRSEREDFRWRSVYARFLRHNVVALIQSATVAAGAGVMAAPYALGYRRRLSRTQLGAHFLVGLGAFAAVALTRSQAEKLRLHQWAELLESKFKHAS